MAFTGIEALLRDRMGLSPASIGSPAIARAVQRRMRECGITTVTDYLSRLQASRAELAALIELVVVPETWFFRDRVPFEVLARHAQRHWLATSTTTPVRILSAPCSTGEEPYSIVMALLDTGLPPERFRVDAIDISEVNLARARAARYGEHSFRGDDSGFRQRHFVQDGAHYRLRPQITERVRFLHGNLLAPGTLTGAAPYDVLFCRNLLIYFDRETQARALRVIERLLARPGLLFLGHAESRVLAGRDFVPLDQPRSFAFVHGGRRTTATGVQPTPFAPPARRRPGAHPGAHPGAQPGVRPGARPPQRPADRPQPVAAAPTGASAAPPCVPVLAAATQLANTGQLAEAAVLCERHLREQGPDARAFHLLGLLREAAGEPDAAEACLRKAIYLDPTHYEALTHLAALLEGKGDHANAELLRQRARRSFERRQEAARSAGGT